MSMVLQAWELVSTMDFSEKFTFKYQREAQSLHWAKKTLSLFVVVMYLARVGADGQVVHERESHLLWSEDTRQDVAHVQVPIGWERDTHT